MTRKKTNLAYISNDSVRKRTLNLRTSGLLKKLDELKILCDVDACAVIYNPYNSTPEVWPSNSEVHEVMDKFEEMPEDEHTKKSVNHEEFLTETLTKVKNQVRRLCQDNNDKLMKEVMFSCLDGNMGDLVIDDGNRGKLCEYIEEHLMKLHHHRQVIRSNPNLETGESSSMAMARNMPPNTMAEPGSSFFTSPQQTQPLVTSNQGPQHISFHGSQFLNVVPTFNGVQSTISTNQRLGHVPSLGNNFMSAPIFNPPQVTNQMQQPIITSNQGVHTPVMNQDEIFYPLNQQDWYVDEMMEHYEQTNFPWMEENNYYINHQL